LELQKLGNESFSFGNYVTAARCFTDALKANPNSHLLLSNRSASYFGMKNYASALRDAEEILSINPYWPKVPTSQLQTLTLEGVLSKRSCVDGTWEICRGVRYFRERAAVGDRESFHSPKTPPCN
jgi:tetratricopeptide (TPR) repeat protein